MTRHEGRRRWQFRLVLLSGVMPLAAAGEDHSHGGADHTPPALERASQTREEVQLALPPPPEGVSDLDLLGLFKPPGRKGLEYSTLARALEGKQVRLLGYMVRHDSPTPGVLLLAPIPLQLHEAEYGQADDLPSATVHVVVPDRAGKVVPYTPGLLLLTGRLELGPRDEPGGRRSMVRLILSSSAAPGAAAAVPFPPRPASPKEHP